MRLPLPIHLATGVWGEREAERFLVARGYRILGRRFRVTLRDEVDLVARDGEILVFVEVKTRKTEAYGRPLSAVDRKKRHVISRAAVRYLGRLRKPVNFRFDVVEVIGSRDEGNPVIRHIQSAFTLDRRYVLPW